MIEKMLRELRALMKLEKLPILGAIIFCFSLPFFQAFVTVSILLWVLFSLTNIRKSGKIPVLLFVPVGLYLLYVLSFFLAPADNYGILERKVSLLIFPLVFYLKRYSKKEQRLFIKSFLAGLILSGIACLLIALFRSIGVFDGKLAFRPEVLPGKGFFESILYGGNFFFGRHFSYFHQTVYYAMFLCAGISILLYRADIFASRRVRRGLIAFFVALLFLISNKGGFIALGGVLFLFISLNTKSLPRKVSLVLLLLFGALAFVKANPRLNESFNKLISGEIELDKNARYGFSTRLLSWDASIELIMAKPFLGHGVARAQEELDNTYERKGYRFPLRDHLNAHNQFLQFWVESGVLSVLYWIAVLLLLIRQAGFLDLSNRHLVYSLVWVLFVNSLFESVMNRFSGISFITFTLCFILANSNPKQTP